MSLVRRLAKAITAVPVTNYTADAAFPQRGQSGDPAYRVNGSAVGTSTAYACVRLLSETVASLPLQVFTRTAAGRIEEDPPPWARRPNGEMTRFRLIERTVASLLIDGNAFWWYQRDNLGRVLEVWPLHPKSVEVGRDDAGTLVYRVKGHRSGREVVDTYDSQQLLHIPFFEGEGGLRGLSPVAACASSLRFSATIDEYGQRLFESGAHLSGVLETDLDMSEDAARRVQAGWAADHAGLYNAHKPGLLTGGLKWKPLSLPNDQAQFLETRRFQVEETCRIFRVPPHMVQDLTRATFSNIEHQGIDFVTHSVRPILVRLEDALLALLDEGTHVRFNVGGLLRGDLLSRYQAHAIGVNTGWESPNEVRVLEDLNPVEGLDVYRSPLNMATIGGPPTEIDLSAQVEAAGALIRAGFVPAAALVAVGLDPIAHLGLLPITVTQPEAS